MSNFIEIHVIDSQIGWNSVNRLLGFVHFQRWIWGRGRWWVWV